MDVKTKDNGKRLAYLVVEGLQQHYDFSVDFKKLSDDIEKKKRGRAISNADRRELISSFKQKKIMR